MITIQRGLDIPIANEPRQQIEGGAAVRHVALVGDDYVGMKPKMVVAVGDQVRLGQTLFVDKRCHDIAYTAPGAGTVVAIHRGEKRRFQSIVIELAEEEEPQVFDHPSDLDSLTRDRVRELLLQSGLWTTLRTRPYSKVPLPGTVPHSIFVTAIDTNPLAADPQKVVSERPEDFVSGLRVLRHLTDGPLFVCTAPQADIPGRDLDFVRVEEFAGPHPAGLPGTHIHFLDPVDDHKTVWHLNYQDVLAIGHLFTTGRLDVRRVVSLAGPAVKSPRLVRTRVGASLEELTQGELHEGDVRVVSGSVLSGRTASGPFAFLGRFHLQVSALFEGRRRELLGWLRPGFDKFSVRPVFASAWSKQLKKFNFTTSLEGSPRAMVPIGVYEQVMPLDILPTFLLRALIIGDTEQAQLLGCLELDEEDLALCSFVCPSKHDYGPILRTVLDRIEKEG